MKVTKKQRRNKIVMKLYDVPRNTKVRVLDEIKVPPGAPEIKKGEVIDFDHIDGMYSYCHNAAGQLVHLAAWAEVEVLRPYS
jgi:hypothetical protein